MKTQKEIVMSLGGSLISLEEGINIRFLSEFNLFIRKFIQKGYFFNIVVGGGRICRHYLEAVKAVCPKNIPTSVLDSMAIKATILNASLVRTVLWDVSFEEAIENYEKIPKTDKPVLVGGGWKPGSSTDFDAVLLAEKKGIKEIINLTNTDFVYSDNPQTNPEAKPLKEISWISYRRLIGSSWISGMNTPFDPVASQKAEELKLIVKIVNGRNLLNLEKCLLGKNFIGTTIGSI